MGERQEVRRAMEERFLSKPWGLGEVLQSAICKLRLRKPTNGVNSSPSLSPSLSLKAREDCCPSSKTGRQREGILPNFMFYSSLSGWAEAPLSGENKLLSSAP